MAKAQTVKNRPRYRNRHDPHLLRTRVGVPEQPAVTDVVVQRHHPVQRLSNHGERKQAALVALVVRTHSRKSVLCLHKAANGAERVGGPTYDSLIKTIIKRKAAR